MWGRKHAIRAGAVVAALLMTMAMTCAQAQADATFNIGPAPLDRVLTEIAVQSGHRIAFDPALVRGVSSPGLTGTMPADAAVRKVLAATGLVLQIQADGEWLVVARDGAATPPKVGGKMIGTVRVRADSASLATLGVNGSSDPIATEGSKSYTVKAAAVASKTPLALKDTPESISVMTQQQLEDRQLTSLSATLAAAPGVTVQDDGTYTRIFSRGFEINNVQIDGGSPLSISTTSNFTSTYQLLDDLSIYDSVTVLRGAAGAFTGVGNPGGVVSLERKRPLDHQQFSAELAGGSYQRAREVMDESTPYLFGNLLRARVILTHDSQDQFFHPATSELSQGYVNFEVDPTSSTAVNFGGTYADKKSTPWVGYPTLADGSQIAYSRSTCLCTPWSHTRTKEAQYFGELSQKIGQDWLLRVNLSANRQQADSTYFQYGVSYGYNGIVPTDPDSAYAAASISPTRSNQYLGDIFTSGKFRLLGTDVDLTAGINVQTISQKVRKDTYSYIYSDVDLINFDPADYPLPSADEFQPSQHFTPRYSQKQYGGYLTLRMTPLSWLHTTLTQRYSHYAVDIVGEDSGSLSQYKSKYSDNSKPNVGIVADLSKDTSIYANYQNIFDRGNYLTSRGGLVDPETGSNVEVGVKNAAQGGKLNTSFAVYYIKQNDVPVFDASASFTYDPTTGSQCCFLSDGTKTVSKGFEATLQGALTDRLQADLSYAHNSIKLKEGSTDQGGVLSLTTPANLFKAWLIWRPPFEALHDKLSVGLGAHVQSVISAATQAYNYDASSNSFVLENILARGGGYTTADAVLKYTLNDTLQLQLNVTNLFDRTYYNTVNVQSGNYFGIPRSFLMTLRAKL
jgi:outer-membrane receptor for ferric coprogen and ferric-rhodotorulic acid